MVDVRRSVDVPAWILVPVKGPEGDIPPGLTTDLTAAAGARRTGGKTASPAVGSTPPPPERRGPGSPHAQPMQEAGHVGDSPHQHEPSSDEHAVARDAHSPRSAPANTHETPTRVPIRPRVTGPGDFGRARPPSSYRDDEGPGSSSRALHPQAVAVGFEPTVTGYATLAFEASSFGRSDTLPRESLDHPGPWTEIGSRGRRPTSPGSRVSLVRGCGRTPSAAPRTPAPGRQR